ncbi:MAG: alcohol dehydrogenase catalytic domain-containing protein [Candidatus Nanopelagicales bacterium]
MEMKGAVLNRTGESTPYATSQPIEVSDLELTDPGPGELLIKMHAAGVCHSDLSVVNGTRIRPVPMLLGHECAGVVIESRADDVAVGEHVVLTFVPRCNDCAECVAGRPALCSNGARANGAGEMLRGGHRITRDGEPIHHHLGVSAFAEYAVVDRGSVVVVPKDVPLDLAVLFGCAVLTGAGAVFNTARVRPGQTVAVWGLGGVGMAAVMAAAAAEAAQVIAIDPDAGKRALALEVGATTSMAPGEPLRDLLPLGVDVALEAVGSAAVLQGAFADTAPGGMTVSVGLPAPDERITISPLALVAESRVLAGSYLGAANPERDIPSMINLWREGRLPVERLRSSTIRLSDINTAMDELAAGRVIRQVIMFDEQ